VGLLLLLLLRRLLIKRLFLCIAEFTRAVFTFTCPHFVLACYSSIPFPLCFLLFGLFTDWRSTDSTDHHDRVQRQLSVSSDSKLLDEDIREEMKYHSHVVMRPKKPPRPKSEVFLNKQETHPRRKRFSAFGVSTPLDYALILRFI